MDQFFTDYLGELDAAHAAIIDALDGLSVEALDWSPAQGVNSIAVLVAHATGAERFWIGDVALGDLKERDRSKEFETRGLTAEQLKARVREVGNYAHGALERLMIVQLDHKRSARTQPDKTLTVGAALAHAIQHTSMHAGHIQLMRDWLKAQGIA